jgi:peptidoglycan hydrolase-like protein with peptidoglycan-binding domain
LALAGAALAAHDGGLAGPSSSFAGTATGGTGTAGGDGGFESDDSGGGFGSPGVPSSGPGGALSGMTVSGVRQLQSDLAQLGYFHHVVTGYYGVVTTAAVKKFQRAVGLKVDGIWGQRSATALKKRLSGG